MGSQRSPELAWPPPAGDLDAVEVLDGTTLQPIQVRTQTPGGPQELPTGSGRHHRFLARAFVAAVVMLVCGLQAADRGVSTSLRTSHVAAPQTPLIVATRFSDVRVIERSPASFSMRGLWHDQTDARASTQSAYDAGKSRPSAARRPATTALRERGTYARGTKGAEISILPVENSRSVERSPAAAVVLVPARPLSEPLPRRVPSPFPVPRGARTTVEVRIDEHGNVTAARVLRSGASYLDVPLIRTARSWRYVPARVGGRPIPSVRVLQVQLPFAAVGHAPEDLREHPPWSR